MQITPLFLTTLDEKLAEGGHGFHLAPRLTAATNRTQTESSFRPLRDWLHARVTQDIAWDLVMVEIQRIPAAKQKKYSAAVKYIEKAFMNQGSHMFITLRNYSEKLSKSQQRYTIPMVAGDPGHGLCGEMAVLWLKEQLSRVTFRSDFQRADSGNVIASDSALRLTQAAMTLRTRTANVGYIEMGASSGMRFAAIGAKLSFARLAGYMARNEDVQGLLIGFWNRAHMVALVRENARSFQFYDANAGSYRIQTNNLDAFLLDYNNVCLPKKWAGYNEAATVEFAPLFTVSRP